MDSKTEIKLESKDYPNLHSMCRLCLKENAGAINIFDSQQSLVIRIFTCTAIEIQPTNSLPKLICENCRIDLEKSYYFRKRSQICNDKLKKHLRLINAGKQSEIFNSADNEDDENELEESIEFLNEMENKENEKRETEIQNRIQKFKEDYEKEIKEKLEMQQEQELKNRLEKLKLKYDHETSECITKLKDDHEKELQRSKEEYERISNERIEKMKENLRKSEINQIIDDIKNFLDTKKTESYKKSRILNTEANNDDLCETISSISKKKKRIVIQQKLQQKMNLNNEKHHEESTVKPTTVLTSSLMDIEMFNVELHPPKKLFKCTYNEDDADDNDEKDRDDDDNIVDENDNDEFITEELLIIEDDKNKLKENSRSENEENVEENENNEESHEINYEIIDDAVEETGSEYNEENRNDSRQDNQIINYESIEVEDYANSLNNDEIETFNDDIEEQLALINDEGLQLHNNGNGNNELNVFDNSEQAIRSVVKESLLTQEGIELDDDVRLDLKKISKKTTQVKARTKEGKVIIMEIQTQGTSLLKPKTKTTTTTTTSEMIVLDNMGNDYDKNTIHVTGNNIKPTAIDDSVRIFRCKSCPQSFSREALLIRHKSVHEKSRGYPCEYCEKWFACRSSLNRHRRVHTGEKPFYCEKCGRNFIQKEILKRHMLTHTGERPYKCPHCDKSFVQKPLLRQHINQKHTKNPVTELHECHLCPKVFMHASGLSRHLITHTGIIFNCNECGRGFSDKSAMKRHQVGVHGKSKVSEEV